jgi:hypothetical protein
VIPLECRRPTTAVPQSAALPPQTAPLLSGFATTGSKFMLIVRQARMVSSGDNEVYTGSGLRGVIPYVQCVVAVFLSQMCSQ